MPHSEDSESEFRERFTAILRATLPLMRVLRIGKGAGTQLIDAAKATAGIVALELWCFQANERARRFYEARGFRAIRFTDGADNEERMPDIRYRWEFTTSFDDAEKHGSGGSRAT